MSASSAPSSDTDASRPWLQASLVRWSPVALALLVLLLLILVVFRRPLADRLWPEARAQALREQAALALAHGRLSAGDGSGARELYEAALAIDPDRNDARIGLMRVASAALAQARSASAADHYTQAHRMLRLARALSVPRAQADLVDARLRQRESAHAGIERLLARAAAARTAHHLDGAQDTALPLYQRVLALEPDRVEALEGREDALSDLLQQARQALQRSDLIAAAGLISRARGYDAGHGDLPDAQARLAKAIDEAHAHVVDTMRAGDLERATDEYRALLQVDLGDAVAQQGLERVAGAWAARAQRMASDFRFKEAALALQRARDLSPHARAVRDAEQAIARAQHIRSRPAPALTKAQRLHRVEQLLREADAAQKRGDLLTPPGDSAFDKLRAARALAPEDLAVRKAGARLLPMARACFGRELRNNNLGRARECLDAQIALEGNGASVAMLRRQLARRWLAIGAERLAAGEIAAAQEAVASARTVDATVPGLEELSTRLATASVNRD